MTRRANEFLQEDFVLSYDHAAVTADLTVKLWKAPRACRIDRALYVNPTGLAEDTTNVFNVKVLKGSTVMFSHSTDSDLSVADASIPADTFIELTPSGTDEDLVMAADDVLAVFFDEGGDTTLPAGRLVIEGRYL